MMSSYRAPGSESRWLTGSHDHIYRHPYEFHRKAGELFCIAACVPVLDSEVLPLDIAGVAQTLLKVPDTSIGSGWRATVTKPPDRSDRFSFATVQPRYPMCRRVPGSQQRCTTRR